MIKKKTINLLIARKDIVAEYSKYTPYAMWTAGACGVLFVLLYIGSFLYLQINIGAYERMKRDISLREKNISDRSSVEGLAVVAHQQISVIEKLLKQKKNYPELLSHIFSLQQPGIFFSGLSIAADDLITLTLTAESSSVLQGYVDTLLALAPEKAFSSIVAQGIIRDRYGKYSLTITMRPHASLLL